jgi:hypothetical protein
VRTEDSHRIAISKFATWNRTVSTSPILSEAEIEQLLNEVDATLKQKNEPIHGRPILAVGEIAQRFGIEISLRSELAARIGRWYRDRYGDRLRNRGIGGCAMTVVSEDVFRIAIPNIVIALQSLPLSGVVLNWNEGTWNEGASIRNPQRDLSGNFVFHIRDLIEKLTATATLSLSASDKEVIEGDVLNAIHCFEKIWDLFNNPIHGLQIESDLVSAVDNVMRRIPPDYGNSRWSSLAAVEKSIKALYKTKNGTEAPHTHILTHLSNLVSNYVSLDTVLLSKVQCSPEVRYSSSSSRQQALEAHKAALNLSAEVAMAIK